VRPNAFPKERFWSRAKRSRNSRGGSWSSMEVKTSTRPGACGVAANERVGVSGVRCIEMDRKDRGRTPLKWCRPRPCPARPGDFVQGQSRHKKTEGGGGSSFLEAIAGTCSLEGGGAGPERKWNWRGAYRRTMVHVLEIERGRKTRKPKGVDREFLASLGGGTRGLFPMTKSSSPTYRGRIHGGV